MKPALLLVDIQNDFCQGGSLAVRDSDAVIRTANRMIACCQQQNIPVIASQDWHPAEHLSFAVNSGTVIGECGELNGLPQVWWPVHCVQNTPGADFHPELNKQAVGHIIYKGENPATDSYSAFYDNDHREPTALLQLLAELQITHLVVLGIATDYCVKFTVLDALTEGFAVTVITDGCRGVNLQPDDSLTAFAEMEKAGALLQTAAQFCGEKE
ncbi:bifunctional nicotinamidase/pyrazinamidase [Morganella morganii]|uniref:bifunctional nicotinamidase/pyrazinamidase n=1 Tax=Morganella morganii TaxID=582 RepID=UPI000911348E|nr:bifunctional nicotinamidase/pyrazinamidase [Morganella morganii]SHL42468.1 nicotinamidase/pyrazinamidase [Morganella morganii]